MATEQNPSNRQIWEGTFGASRIREDDYSTMSGIPLEPVYGPDDGEFPGQYPYTRGPHASMYRSKLWTMRMFAGFGTAEDTNECGDPFRLCRSGSTAPLVSTPDCEGNKVQNTKTRPS